MDFLIWIPWTSERKKVSKYNTKVKIQYFLTSFKHKNTIAIFFDNIRCDFQKNVLFFSSLYRLKNCLYISKFRQKKWFYCQTIWLPPLLQKNCAYYMQKLYEIPIDFYFTNTNQFVQTAWSYKPIVLFKENWKILIENTF